MKSFAVEWRDLVARQPAAPFLTFAGQEEGEAAVATTWSYGEFDELVRRAAGRFAAAGVVPGSAVHLALTNSPSFVVAWLAANRLGAWIVPSDPFASASELGEHRRRTRPQVGLCATTRLDLYRAEPDGLPATVIDIDERDTALAWTGDEALAPEQHPVEQIEPRQRAAVMFTSGTTGRPKGVEITQANYAFAGATMAAAAELGPDDVLLVVLPLFHANAQYYSFAAAIVAGSSVALMPTFSASRFVEQATRHRATCASLFAGPMRMILARSAPDTPPPPTLRHCWFAQNLTVDQYARFTALAGVAPRQLYGMTETIPAVLTDSATDPRPDTMGYVTPGCSVELIDGEVVVGGERGVTLFAGYLDDPETTAASFDADGWFHTGDQASRDADGRFRFVGRHSDVLKVAGENVSTVEVEQAIATHPDVADVAVIGVPDDVRDEVVAAIVVAVDGIDHDQLRRTLDAWCATRLSKSKRPHHYRFVAELPRTSVGKIKKYQLRDVASATNEEAAR